MSYIVKRKEINLEWILDAYTNTLNKGDFFNNFFYNITGNRDLREQIESGLSEGEIRESWQDKLNEFKEIRKKYLLYKD